MAVKFFFIIIETRKYSNMSWNIVISAGNEKGCDLVNALSCRIFTVDPNILFFFQMLSKIFECEIPKNIKFGPSHVAPQPP